MYRDSEVWIELCFLAVAKPWRLLDLTPSKSSLTKLLRFSNVCHRTLPSTSVDWLGRSASCPHPTCIPSSLSMRANLPFKRQLPGSALAEVFPNTYAIPHSSPFPPPFLLNGFFYPLITHHSSLNLLAPRSLSL